jgi:ABC-type multidrug transport system fused ATPase/permease subunit
VLQLVDNMPLKEMSLRHWRSRLSLVKSVGWLTAGTVKENIAYGDTRNVNDIPLGEFVEAAEMADLHEVIQTLPQVRLYFYSLHPIMLGFAHGFFMRMFLNKYP